MNKFRMILFGLLAMCLIAAGPVPKDIPLVVIDPAHGGRDEGVIVTDKIREKDLTLKIALLLKKELEKTGRVRVALTRNSDTDMGVGDRVAAIKKWHPAALVSLHVNKGFGRQAHGFEVYFPGFKAVDKGKKEEKGEAQNILHSMQKTDYLNKSVLIAQKIQLQLERVFPKENRGLREASIELLDALTVPAVVVEMGFASNRENLKKLTNEASQMEIARALSRGLVEGVGAK